MVLRRPRPILQGGARGGGVAYHAFLDVNPLPEARMLRRRSMGWMLLAVAACGGGGDGNPTGTSAVASVSLDVPTLALLVGESKQLSATARNAAGNVVTGAPAATWTSSNYAVATVDATGVVTALIPGTADIRATIAGKRASAQVTVTSAATRATVTMTGNVFSPSRVTIKAGGTVEFVFGATPHTVIFEQVPGAPNSIDVATANKTETRQFNTPRVYRYNCSIHGSMVGDVNVVP